MQIQLDPNIPVSLQFLFLDEIPPDLIVFNPMGTGVSPFFRPRNQPTVIPVRLRSGKLL